MDAIRTSSSPIEENFLLISAGKKSPLKLFLNFRNFCPIRVEPPPYFFSISSVITRAATTEGSDANQEHIPWYFTVKVVDLVVTYKAMIWNNEPDFTYPRGEPDSSICR